MRVIFAALMLISTPAFAAPQRVWISEFATARVEAQAPMAQLPSLINQPPLDVAVSPKTSAAFNASTRYIRVICEMQCAINAKGVTATVNDLFVPAMRPEYFGVQPGGTISVIAAP